LVEINSTLVWQIINFLVLLWLLKRYLYGPITEMIDKRSQKINDDLDEAENRKKEAQELKEKYEMELKNARQQAQEIIEEAENRGKKQAREIINRARADAEKVKENKLAEVEQARKEAVAELRNEVASISMLLAGKIIKEQMDHKKHEQLINQYIEDLNRDKLGEVK